MLCAMIKQNTIRTSILDACQASLKEPLPGITSLASKYSEEKTLCQEPEFGFIVREVRLFKR